MLLSEEQWPQFETYLLVEKKLANSNIAVFKYIFKKLTNYFSTKDLNRNNFNLFLMEIKPKFKTSYLNSFIRLIKHLDKFLNLNEFTDYSLFPELPMKELDTLTEQEIKKLAEVWVKYRINEKSLNLKMKCLILLMGSVGCRINEALSLTWNDVKSNYVVFKNTKNGETRFCPILPSLYNDLQKLKECIFVRMIKDHGQKVFQTAEQNVNRDLKTRQSLCQIKKPVYCHALRHAVITNLLKQGVSVPLVAKLVGHSNWNSTAKYTHLVLTDIENMLYSYSPLWKEKLTFDMMAIRVKQVVERMVNKFTLEVKQSDSELLIRVIK